MARTTTNKIDLEKLAADSKELREVLKIIMDPKAFEELTDESLKEACQPKKRLSRGMLVHLETLLECDHVELIKEESSMDSMVCFLVEKKDGSGRFIVNCRPLNKSQKPPGDMGLPPIRELIRGVLMWSYASQCDGCNFFCQFELHPEIRKKFPIRLADLRGKIVQVVSKRMCMGWKHACRISQAVANHIMKDIGIGWVDNFLVGGQTMEEFETRRERLRLRLKRYNIEVDDLDMEVTQDLFALGLEFDLKSHLYRIDPKWLSKRTDTLNRSMDMDNNTFRETFELYGSLIWASYVKDEPLWIHAEALAALSQIAKQVNQNWDDKCDFPEFAKNDIREWVEDITRNCWCKSPQSIKETELTSRGGGDGDKRPRVFSDASDTGAAWVKLVEKMIVAGQQWHRSHEDGDIFMGELDAFLGAVKEFGDSESYAVDNLGLRLAVKKGHSSSYAANALLRKVCGKTKPTVWW